MEFNSEDQFATTKYIIKITYTIKGHVDVMDIIGALFGQTEGLLNDLELRELQKSGRIGRIQVQNNNVDGNSVGEILIPSSLDRVETAILAATIESVDRVGPCTAQMHLAEIMDIREDKRKKIMDRATELLQKWDINTPEAEEIGESILDKMRTGDVVEYGPDKLAAGQDIDSSQQIIIVEGVADVKALMKAGFRNAICTNGTSIPKTIIDLTKKKSCIAFVDGDRGGEMILKELLAVADVDYIAVAPKGVMVEELTRKEIIKHLQNKKTLQEYLAEQDAQKRDSETQSSAIKQQNRSQDFKHQKGGKESTFKNKVNLKKKGLGKNQNQKHQPRNQKRVHDKKEPSHNNKVQNDTTIQQTILAPVISIDPKVAENMNSILASNEAIGLNENNEQTFRVGNTKVFTTLDTVENTKTLILDGVVTQRLLDKAIEKNISELFAINIAKDLQIPPDKKINIRLFKDYVKSQ